MKVMAVCARENLADEGSFIQIKNPILVPPTVRLQHTYMMITNRKHRNTKYRNAKLPRPVIARRCRSLSEGLIFVSFA